MKQGQRNGKNASHWENLRPYLPDYQVDIVLKMEIKFLLQGLDSLIEQEKFIETRDSLQTMTSTNFDYPLSKELKILF